LSILGDEVNCFCHPHSVALSVSSASIVVGIMAVIVFVTSFVFSVTIALNVFGIAPVGDAAVRICLILGASLLGVVVVPTGVVSIRVRLTLGVLLLSLFLVGAGVCFLVSSRLRCR
jgi:hypothetical protein